MKQRCLALLAILLLLGLASCGMQTPGSNAAKEVAAPTETTETVPETTVPLDGDPNSVTCKGSYTATATNTAAVATMGSKDLWHCSKFSNSTISFSLCSAEKRSCVSNLPSSAFG